MLLLITTSSRYALAQHVTCYPIRSGDTAAHLAERLTGNANNRREPWFQIVDATTAKPVSKARYDRIQAGWQVCVATKALSPPIEQVPDGPPMRPHAAVVEKNRGIGFSTLWLAVSLFVVVSGLIAAWGGHLIGQRRADIDIMKAFGDKFVSEFARPLFRSAADIPVRSRLRFAPARGRLEILLAPGNGRTYPNLFDHKKNVAYDVERVVRLLRDDMFVNGPLYAEGRWVVIPFRFESRNKEGAL